MNRLLLYLRVAAFVFTVSLFLRGFFPHRQTSKGFSTVKIALTEYSENERQGNSNVVSPRLDLSLKAESSLSPPTYETINSSKEHEAENEFNDDDVISGIKSHTTTVKRPRKFFQRVVFMIIDAFRADFFFGPYRYMPRTHNLLKNKHGLQFTAEAHPPTVTLPRIKAITTGNIPSFIDVVLNFGSSALEEDNIITQMKLNGRNIIFFGDDTWINLFPHHFLRSDGTTSFFVSDYTEVDHNVSRHLPSELRSTDWDVMILHFLGLDHIGHLAGPSSPLVKPKLLEMDDLIYQIYTSMETWAESGLLVVCGDHGMSDQGGHGGATVGEISVPVLFLSPHIVNKRVKQVRTISQTDLCPTLAVLMDLPVPKNSLGQVITDTLIGYSMPEKVSVSQQNAKRTVEILKGYVKNVDKESSYLMYTNAEQQVDSWVQGRNLTLNTKWLEQGQHLLALYSESLRLMADKIGRLSTEYDVYAMALAMFNLVLLLLSLVMSHMDRKPSVSQIPLSSYTAWLGLSLGSAVLTHITMCTNGVPSALVCQASAGSVANQLAIIGTFLGCSLHLLSQWEMCFPLLEQLLTWTQSLSVVEKFLVLGTFFHTFTLMASSFVEEEHQTFYFYTTTIHLLLLMQLFSRVLTGWRQRKNLRKHGLRDFQDYDQLQSKKHIKIGDTFEMPTLSSKDNNEGGIYENKDLLPELSRYGTIHADSAIVSNSGRNRRQRDMTSPVNRERDKESPDIRTQGQESSHSSEENDVLHELGNLQHGGSMADTVHRSMVMHLTASLVVVLFLLRLLRRWNQTGNKWLDVPDFGDWLVRPQNKHYLSLIVIFSMMILGVTRGHHVKKAQAACINLSLAMTYLYKVAAGSLFFPSTHLLSTNGVTEARASFIFMGIVLLISVLPQRFTALEEPVDGDTHKTFPNSTEKKNASAGMHHSELKAQQPAKSHTLGLGGLESSSPTVRQKDLTGSPTISPNTMQGSSCDDSEEAETEHQDVSHHLEGVLSSWLCLMCLLLRAENIPVVAAMSLIEQMVTPVILHSQMRPTYILLYSIWMGQTFFFFQGNSNSISTVDVSAGYTGVAEYMPVLIGFLMCMSTYAGPIFWLLAFVRIMHVFCAKKGNIKRYKAALGDAGSTLLLCRALPVTVYAALVAAQRYHLFVWTVFSPKLLYEAASSVMISIVAALLYTYSML